MCASLLLLRVEALALRYASPKPIFKSLLGGKSAFYGVGADSTINSAAMID